MIRLVTWNVQWFRGLDGRVDPARVIAHARSLADFDVLCVQELADHYPAPMLAGNDEADQFAVLAALLPGFEIVAGVGSDHPGSGRRRRFGNAIASRLPVRQVRRHLLPWPADPSVSSMQRVAVEATVATPSGEWRVTTTHLEYYSRIQRAAQVARLRELHAQASAHAEAPGAGGDADGPFRVFPEARAAIVAGDFNLPAGDAQYRAMLEPFADRTPRFHDAWTLVHGSAPQPATFCRHVPFAPGSVPIACDFVFVSDDLAPRVRSVAVDTDTRLSDHQPVVVTLGD
ncbi:MAG: endonuclease/exonuclease/phosphatase family protein [Burkholderiales bacterium]